MAISLYTVSETSHIEHVEKQSRFIAHIVPIDHFEGLLAELRINHPKASHHVTAFRVIADDNRINESAKDDGEPAGTSGMPVLKTLIGSNLVNTGMIVTRYFGGTKLGTGGLARAYAAASKLAISQAHLVEWERIATAEYQTDFASSSRIENLVDKLGLSITDRQFDEVGVRLLVEGAETALEKLNAEFPTQPKP